MSNLLVPMHVEAVCVGETDSNSAVGPMANFSNLANQNLAFLIDHCLPEPFAQDGFLAVGAHLHWALPDALNRGSLPEHDSTDTLITFPDIPNRWLVTRQWLDPESQEPQQRSWVIESDFISKTGVGTTIPSKDGFSYLGKVTEHTISAPWSEAVKQEDDHFPHLKTYGYGEASFAALYANSQSCLGFHDSLADIKLSKGQKLSLSYVVAGWYSDKQNDILCGQSVESIMNRLQWRFEGETAPDSTLCHGSVNNIEWDPARRYFDDRGNSPEKFDIAVGNTMAEALSALLSKTNQPFELDTKLESLLNLLQLGLLNQYDPQDDSAIRMQEIMHQERFHSVPGGMLWTVNKVTKVESGVDELEASDDVTLDDSSGELGELLAAINELQEQLDRLHSVANAKRQQIFCDWHHYIQVVHNKDHKNDGITYKPIKKLIEQQIDELGEGKHSDNGIKQQVIELELQIAQKRDEIKSHLKDINAGSQYELTQIPAPRYWQPNEPVVLLHSKQTQPSIRYGQDTKEHGFLPCRSSHQVVNSLSLGNGQVVLHGSLPKLGSLPHQDDIEQLLMESALLAPHSIPHIVKYNTINSTQKIKLSHQEVAQLQRQMLSLTPLQPIHAETEQQPPAGIAINVWKNQPWHPVLLEWRISYSPLQYLAGEQLRKNEAYHNDFIRKNYYFDGVDYSASTTEPAQISATYSGFSILTPNASVSLQQQIKNYITQHPNSQRSIELSGLLKMIDGMPILCQNLSGFNAALLMLTSVPQLPIADPFNSSNTLADFSEITVANAVGQMNTAAPKYDQTYSPIRGGYIRFEDLRIVDTFGQLRQKINPNETSRVNVLRASSLTNVKANDAMDPRSIYLPPRVVQPSRLRLRWLAATQHDELHSLHRAQMEVTDHPSISPICGWILPNHIEQNFMFYGQQGNAIGALGTDNAWQPAIEAGVKDKDIRKAFENQNPHLRDVALHLKNNGQVFLEPLFEAIQRINSTIIPNTASRYVSLAGLLYRPLAVVRARLTMELNGLPAYHQSVFAFRQTIDNFKPDMTSENWRETAGYPSVKIPVRLGAIDQINDGLIGYFINDDFNTFYVKNGFEKIVPSDNQQTAVVPETHETLSLSCDPDADPIELTMLIDPRAPIRAITGILPVKTISIPSSHFAHALRAINITFLSTPVLTGRRELSLSLPRVDNHEWVWRSGDSREPVITDISASSVQAQLNYSPQRLREGWLQLENEKSDNNDTQLLRSFFEE